ncbi:MAG: SLC13 family permease [Gammaproteobacteria bacterium]
MRPYGLRQALGLVLGPILFLLIGLVLGPDAGLDSAASWVAGTVALMTVWWITEPVSLGLTACLPLLSFPLLAGAPWVEVLMQYVDPVNFLFLGGMMIAACMQQWGLHRRIALAIIARAGAGPRRIVLGFMLATAFVSLWISNTATAVMMFPIAMAVLLKVEEETGPQDPRLRRFGLALMLGVAYAASIGGIGTKIGTAPNLVFVRQVEVLYGRDVDFVTWAKVGLPIVALTLPLVWIYLVRIAAPLPAQGWTSTGSAVAAEREGLGRMSRGERVALVAFLSAALLWVFRKDLDLGFATLPGWWDLLPFGWEDVLGQPLATLPAPLAKLLQQDSGDALVAMSIALLLLGLPITLRPWRSALAIQRVMQLRWSLLVLLGGGFAMAYGIQRSGLSQSIAGALQGMARFDPVLVFAAVCLVTIAMSEVASNVATASILLPIIAASAGELGVAPAPLMLAATISASFGFMLPAGTPPNAIAYSSGYISVPQMARSGVLVDLVGGLLVALLSYALAPWALGLD